MKNSVKNNPISSSTKTLLNVVSPITSALSYLNPAFASIPIIISVINEINNYFNSNYISQRLNLLFDTCQKQNIEIEELKNTIATLDEHSSYVLRNHIKGLCINALPETAELYATTIIQYLKNDSSNMNEEICEIVSSFNAFDIELLLKIKDFITNGNKDSYNLAIEQKKEEPENFNDINISTNTSIPSKHKISLLPKMFFDRNIIYENNTIFWDDFCAYHKLNVKDMGTMLNYPGEEIITKKTVYDWAFLIRSMLKLQNLGVIQVEFKSTLGSISTNNINRFHITLFGQELIKLI